MGGGFEGRIVFDIGCADGGYLTRIARRYPAVAFVGLDWKHKAIHDAATSSSDAGLQNVALLRARAQDLTHIFADGEVGEIWLFHPEPCDRPVELPNRLIREPFLLDAHRVLRGPNGRLCIKTDHPGYYQWILSLLGLPHPAWFGDPSLPDAPRVRRKDLMRTEDVPSRSAAVLDRFDVAMNSTDFWRDMAQRPNLFETRLFAPEKTFYETRYLSKRLPIYYVELARR